MDYFQLASTFFAALAAVISFQSFRLAGKKRSAEMQQDWLNNLRDKVAQIFAETSKWESGTLDTVKIHYLMEYIDMMLDMSLEHHRNLKNALFPVVLNAEKGAEGALSAAYAKLGDASRAFFKVEQDKIRSGLERWI